MILAFREQRKHSEIAARMAAFMVWFSLSFSCNTTTLLDQTRLCHMNNISSNYIIATIPFTQSFFQPNTKLDGELPTNVQIKASNGSNMKEQ